MSIRDDTLHTIAVDDRIMARLPELSPGDHSVLFSLLDTQDARAMTSDGSANFRLWSCFAEHGWMEQVDDNSLGPETLAFRRIFTLTELGRRAVPVVLAQFQATRP